MSIPHNQPYLVLARKYRPAALHDLKGQDALVRTLSNAIHSNRIAHAFLLTGIRGVGKTTTARIIARSLNCVGTDGQNGPTTEPCGLCQHCVAMKEDRHPDILEMDAASRTGVGDIREIIENARYLPVTARYKIYIIDEVHMLSTNAFNALLKTLEEPPAHVKFIFATTEIRKIPVTILSRCQRFDLRRVTTEVLQAHLADIAGNEHVTVEAEALRLIAEAAEGSVRDSLSLLDQAISHSHAQHITVAQVRTMLGIADKSVLFTLIDAIAAGQIDNALKQMHMLYMAGTEPVQLLEDLLELVHRLTCMKINPQLVNQAAAAENEIAWGTKRVEQLGIPYLSRMWQMLLKGLAEVRQAPIPLSAAEMILIRLAYVADLPTPAAIIKQLAGQKSIPTLPEAPIAKNIPSFKEMVELFREHKELLLYHALQTAIHLVNFAPGMIEIRPTREAPADLKKRIEACLLEWTGQEWAVILSTEEGQPTLQTEIDSEQARITSEVSAHPAVKAVLEQFPGAAIKEVRERQ